MNNYKIAIIGLGYVGLPLGVEFAKRYPVIGFDINKQRISELRNGEDATLEVDHSLLKSVTVSTRHERGIYFSGDQDDLKEANVFIVTVPTPTDKNNNPDLTPLLRASETVGRVLSKGDIVIYESTVYPGATEEMCIPVLERISGLLFNNDFFAGYSPERINPGDKEHTVAKILKVTSGSTPDTADIVDTLYKTVITAGTYKASSIRVAEAAKVIENSQRDINIAFVNELAKIFNRMGIDTQEVLDAAGTKWNFLKFTPGLVGGHCIGVDPYYLAQKAQEVGYHPEIILAGRRVNDTMGVYIAQQVIKAMIKKDVKVKGARILLLGFTFKENCPDVRNSKVIDILRELETFEISVTTYDPWADPKDVFKEYNVDITNNLDAVYNRHYDAVVLAVAHKEFLDFDFNRVKKENSVVYDVKSFLARGISDERL